MDDEYNQTYYKLGFVYLPFITLVFLYFISQNYLVEDKSVSMMAYLIVGILVTTGIIMHNGDLISNRFGRLPVYVHLISLVIFTVVYFSWTKIITNSLNEHENLPLLRVIIDTPIIKSGFTLLFISMSIYFCSASIFSIFSKIFSDVITSGEADMIREISGNKATDIILNHQDLDDSQNQIKSKIISTIIEIIKTDISNNLDAYWGRTRNELSLMRFCFNRISRTIQSHPYEWKVNSEQLSMFCSDEINNDIYDYIIRQFVDQLSKCFDEQYNSQIDLHPRQFCILVHDIADSQINGKQQFLDSVFRKKPGNIPKKLLNNPRIYNKVRLLSLVIYTGYLHFTTTQHYSNTKLITYLGRIIDVYQYVQIQTNPDTTEKIDYRYLSETPSKLDLSESLNLNYNLANKEHIKNTSVKFFKELDFQHRLFEIDKMASADFVDARNEFLKLFEIFLGDV